MAKGDDKRQRNKIDHEGGTSQNHLNNLRTDMVIPQAQSAQNNYTNAVGRGWEDYNQLQGQYQNWAETGGYGKGDLANIRSRALSPLRAVYSNANREVDRSRALQGGYSPGYGVLKARMAREMSSGMSDAATNAEAQIAQMVNEGKKFGLAGKSNLYSATPGMASHFGGMQNATMNNWLNTENMQQRLNLGLIGAQQDASSIPGTWQTGFNNAMTGVRTIGGAIAGL